MLIDLKASNEGEPEISDELEAEYTEENPFSLEADEDDITSAEVRFLYSPISKSSRPSEGLEIY